MATPPANTTLLGKRMLAMYADGRATREQLDQAYYEKGWISTADYEKATAPPPEPESTTTDAPAEETPQI